MNNAGRGNQRRNRENADVVIDNVDVLPDDVNAIVIEDDPNALGGQNLPGPSRTKPKPNNSTQYIDSTPKGFQESSIGVTTSVSSFNLLFTFCLDWTKGTLMTNLFKPLGKVCLISPPVTLSTDMQGGVPRVAWHFLYRTLETQVLGFYEKHLNLRNEFPLWKRNLRQTNVFICRNLNNDTKYYSMQIKLERGFMIAMYLLESTSHKVRIGLYQDQEPDDYENAPLFFPTFQAATLAQTMQSSSDVEGQPEQSMLQSKIQAFQNKCVYKTPLHVTLFTPSEKPLAAVQQKVQQNSTKTALKREVIPPTTKVVKAFKPKTDLSKKITITKALGTGVAMQEESTTVTNTSQKPQTNHTIFM